MELAWVVTLVLVVLLHPNFYYTAHIDQDNHMVLMVLLLTGAH
jgi:hypothetical protein